MKRRKGDGGLGKGKRRLRRVKGMEGLELGRGDGGSAGQRKLVE